MFLVFEGIDGCGKGTQAERLTRYLGATPMKYPDRSTPIGKLIDSWLKGRLELHTVQTSGPDKFSEPADPVENGLAMQALLTANKMEVMGQLEENLRKGHVVCDRYSPSAVAYGSSDGIPFDYMVKCHHEGLLQPFLYILLDISPEVALKRIASRVGDDTYGSVKERLVRARANYKRMARMDPGRWLVLDGEAPMDEITKQICATLMCSGRV